MYNKRFIVQYVNNVSLSHLYFHSPSESKNIYTSLGISPILDADMCNKYYYKYSMLDIFTIAFLDSDQGNNSRYAMIYLTFFFQAHHTSS